MISAQGGRNRGKAEDIRTAEGLEREAVMAMMFAENVSKSIGQKPEVPQLRLNAIAKSLMAEMDGHFMNFSVLSSKYLAKCADLLRDPKATVDSRFGFSDQAEDATPIPITIDPFTKAVAERNGFRIEVYKIRVADGRLLLVPSVDEQAAMQAAEAWAKANPVRRPAR